MYLPAYLPTFLQSCTYFPTCTSFPTCTYLPSYLPTFLPPYMYLLPYLYLPTFLHVPTYLPVILKSVAVFSDDIFFYGDKPITQPLNWRARHCNSFYLSLKPAQYGCTQQGPAGIHVASRVIKAHKPPHHIKAQHLGKSF